MKAFQRIIALALAFGCLLGCLSGCKKEKSVVTEAIPTYSTGAMGRYVEKSIPLPEGKYVQDMVMLNDGRLRVSLTREDGGGIVCTTGSDRQAWEHTWEVPEEILKTGRVSQLALSPDGTVFCSTRRDKDESGNYGFHFLVIRQDGSYNEIPITCPDVDYSVGYMVSYCDFTDSGKLIIAFQGRSVREMDLTTGEVGENFNEQRSIMKMGCAGEDTYIAGWDTVCANIDGVSGSLEGVMGQQLTDSLKATEGNTPKFTFWRNSDGYLFYTTHEGLFSYIPGGSITEELVSGSRTTLGDPRFLPVAMTGTEDDTFYVLGSRAGEEPMLLYYTYDAEVPTVSDTYLKIYSLYESEDLPQMVSQYQVAHPEVTIDLEIGMVRDSGITVSDALRTLNTEILAGNGPDLICLDGLNLDTYREKGLLTDLSGILAQAESTLTQITRCYEKNGQIIAVPTSFQLPAVYGPEHIVSQIHDWDSLVEAAAQAKAERPDAFGVLAAFQPVDMADKFYDCSSFAWMKDDGTISAETLTQYYTAMKKIWSLDSELQQRWLDRIYEELYFAPGEFVGMMGASSIIGTGYCIGFGVLSGMDSWSRVLAGDEELGNYVTAPLSPEGSGVFIPKGVMGILSTSQHSQAAGEFLKFMLSDAVQSKDLTYSFPVNQVAFDRETTEDRGITGYISGGGVDGVDYDFACPWPDEENRQMLRSWVDGLHIPASTDHIIRNMIMDQMHACLLGEITPEEAAQAAMQSLNLYLAE